MRIRDLAREMEIGVSRFYLVLSRARGPLAGSLKELVEGLDIELAGIVPDDPEVARFDEEGKPLIELGEGSAARSAVREILEGVLQGVKG